MSTARFTRLEPDQRRREILAAARHLFSEHGYAAVSTEEIACRAGIRRGLVHHYFGTKRDLFIEVVRSYVDAIALPTAPAGSGVAQEQVVSRSVDRWLDLVEQEAAAWFAAMSGEGLGRDPELGRLVAAARDATVEAIVTVLGIAEPTPALRAVLRVYAGLAESATREWLHAGRLSRAETHALLSAALLAMVRDVAPAVEAAGQLPTHRAMSTVGASSNTAANASNRPRERTARRAMARQPRRTRG